MTNLLTLRSKSDIIGALASTLCFAHCLATPFFFVAQAGLMVGEASHPWWWGTLDLLFLAIAFFAVYWSAKHTSQPWIKYAFWCLLLVLAAIVINEKLEIAHIAEEAIYIPTLGLISLHFYNRRYCRCEDDGCCTQQ